MKIVLKKSKYKKLVKAAKKNSKKASKKSNEAIGLLLAKLKGELGAVKHEAVQRENHIVVLKAEMKEFESDAEKLSIDLFEVEVKNETLKQETAKLHNFEMRALRDKVDKLTKSNNDLSACNSTLEQYNHELVEGLEKSEVLIKHHMNRKVNLSIPIERYQLEEAKAMQDALDKERKKNPRNHNGLKIGMRARGRGPRPSRSYHQHLPQSMATECQVYVTIEEQDEENGS